jgi:hypothetical protein
MRRAALALAILAHGCSDRPFERVSFEAIAPATDEGRRVVEGLTRKEAWAAGFRAVEEKIGPFPAGLTVRVSFDWPGDEYGQGSGSGDRGWVRFNLSKLEDYQRKVDEIERRKKSLEAEGKKPVFRVPAARLDRMVWHELTHVLQRGCEGPDWFREGMAVWVSEDPNSLAAFTNAGKQVASIDTQLPEKNDAYARGHLFWKWLDSKGVARKVAQATVIDRKDWKSTLVEATGLSWESLVAEEREWSATAAK